MVLCVSIRSISVLVYVCTGMVMFKGGLGGGGARDAISAHLRIFHEKKKQFQL